MNPDQQLPDGANPVGGWVGDANGSQSILGATCSTRLEDDERTAMSFEIRFDLSDGETLTVRTGRKYAQTRNGLMRSDNDAEARLDCYEPFFDFEVLETGERGYGVVEYSMNPPTPRFPLLMRAAYLVAPQELELRETPIPPPGPTGVALRVLACGICGSNLHGWRHPDLSVSASAEPEPGASGHEVAAVVDSIGAAVNTVAPGDLVVVEPNLTGACHRCDACGTGRYWFCHSRAPIPSWGFAQNMVIPERALFAMPDKVDPGTATLIEPLACGIHAIRSSSTSDQNHRIDGATVSVLGAGVAGLLAAAAAPPPRGRHGRRPSPPRPPSQGGAVTRRRRRGER